MRSCVAVFVLAGGLALTGCEQIKARLPNLPQSVANAANPFPQPPPVPVEIRPQPPVSEDALMWQPGHWDWNGSAFLWISGKWIDRTGHGTTWQDGYWANTNGTWAWMPAHWM